MKLLELVGKNLHDLVEEVKNIASEEKMDATDSTLFVKIVSEAWERLEERETALLRARAKKVACLEEQNAKDLDSIYIGPAIDEISSLVEKITEKLPADYHIKISFSNHKTFMGRIRLEKSYFGQLPRLDLDKDLGWDGKEYMVVKER